MFFKESLCQHGGKGIPLYFLLLFLFQMDSKKTYKELSQICVIIGGYGFSLFFLLYGVYSVVSLIFPEILETTRPSLMPGDILYTDFLGMKEEFGDEYFSDFSSVACCNLFIGVFFLFIVNKVEREYRYKCE